MGSIEIVVARVGNKRGALTAPVCPGDCESALVRAKALPREPTKRGAKVLHEASLQRITVVLGALVRPRRSTALRSAKPTGLDNLIERLQRIRQPLIQNDSSEGGDEIGRQRVQR